MPHTAGRCGAPGLFQAPRRTAHRSMRRLCKAGGDYTGAPHAASARSLCYRSHITAPRDRWRLAGCQRRCTSRACRGQPGGRHHVSIPISSGFTTSSAMGKGGSMPALANSRTFFSCSPHTLSSRQGQRCMTCSTGQHSRGMWERGRHQWRLWRQAATLRSMPGVGAAPAPAWQGAADWLLVTCECASTSLHSREAAPNTPPGMKNSCCRQSQPHGRRVAAGWNTTAQQRSAAQRRLQM